MDKRGVLVGVVAGFIVGYHWPKIKKFIAPTGSAVVNGVSSAVIGGIRYVVELKESVEDSLEERKAVQKDNGGLSSEMVSKN